MGNLYDLNHACTPLANLGLGTELNKYVTRMNKMQNKCLSDGSWAEGTNTKTVKNDAIVKYMIAGTVYHKAVTDNQAMTACAAQATGTTCLYLLSLDASGTLTITKGATVASGTGTDSAAIPVCPSAEVPVSLMQITTSGASFTCGTTDLGATGITDVFYDLKGMSEGDFQAVVDLLT